MSENKRKKPGRHALFLQDVLLSCMGSLCAFLLVRWVTEPIFGFTYHLLIYLAGALVFTALGMIISGASREVSRRASVWSGRRILITVLIKEAGMVILMVAGLVGLESLRIWLVVMADMVFSVVLMIYPRIIVNSIRKENQELRSVSENMNTLVFGDDEAALELAIRMDQEDKYNVIGLLSRNPEYNGKMLGDFVIYYASDEEGLEKLQWQLGGIDCVMFPKNSNQAGPGRGTGSGLGSKSGSTLVQKANAKPSEPVRSHMGLAGRVIKRTFDVTFSGLLLLLFSPLIGICALAILLEDGKPVLYKQERIGKGGKPFNILKFRSMRVDAEAGGTPLLYAGDNDPRLTRVGKFLRVHHLDELPQFWNVFVGDMSFIGYRPERQFFIDKIMDLNPRYQYLYQIRPGITSYATLYNGYTDSVEKMLTRLDMDLYYLRNHSVMFDFRILGLTFLSIVSGKKI